MKRSTIKVYFPAQYPEHVSPAQRFRYEQYLPYFAADNVTVKMEPFIGSSVYPIIFKPGNFLKKILGIVSGFIRRIASLFTLFKYDCIFINREASAIGPPVFEWIYAKLLGKKIIFDIDDAIWLQSTSEANKIAHSFRCQWKFRYIIKWSHVIIAGNDYLANYARKYNSNVLVIPTCVDTAIRYNLRSDQNIEKITIGWTGSFSTMQFLEMLVPVFISLRRRYDFKLLVISNAEPTFDMEDMEYVPWSEEAEVIALQQCQIGCMPMKKDEWSLGKCGFKIIQYMALGIVPVADDWGVNAQIIEDGINGSLVQNTALWENALESLMVDVEARKKMSEHGVRTIEDRYSVKANYPKLLAVTRAASV